MQTAARVLVEPLGVRLEVGDQRCAMRDPLRRLAEAVDLEPHVAPFDQTEVAKQRPRP